MRFVPGEAGASGAPAKVKHPVKKKHRKTTQKAKPRSPSPVSRYALLFVALLLPLRRSLRMKKL